MLYPQLLYVVAGAEHDKDGGYGFQNLQYVSVALKNYISRDPASMLTVLNNQTETNLAILIHSIKKCLEVNRTEYEWIDGISLISLIIALFENLHGKIDNEIGGLLFIIVNELNLQQKPYDRSETVQLLLY